MYHARYGAHWFELGAYLFKTWKDEEEKRNPSGKRIYYMSLCSDVLPTMLVQIGTAQEKPRGQYITNKSSDTE